MGARRVLVTDGEQRSTLAVVRSLGRGGYTVSVSSSAGRSLAGASRYADEDIAVGDPLSDPERYGEAMSRALGSTSADLLIPMTEGAMRTVLARFPGEEDRIPCGSLAAFLRISNKGAVLEAAESVGLAVPAQRTLHDRKELLELQETELPFPLVVKPARSVAADDEGRLTRTAVRYAADPAELERVVDGIPDEAFPLLLQQRVVGPGVGVFLLVWRDRLVASFSHRRLREKPPSGGVSVYRESVPVDPELLEGCVRLLRHFDWEGVAMVEFKVDRDTGVPYVMEINPRFWGSLQLAIDAGVDFPGLLAATALGEEVEGPSTYKLGVRSRWWWGDVDQLIIRARDRNEASPLPPDAPGLGASVWDFLHLWRPGDRSEVLRLSDPRPFLRETRLWFRRIP